MVSFAMNLLPRMLGGASAPAHARVKGDAVVDELLQDDREEDARKHGKRGACHQVVPLRALLRLEHGEADGQGGIVGTGHDDQRPEEIVPLPDEGEERQKPDRRHGERHDDADEDAQARGAVNSCRLLKLHGDGEKELSHQEGAKGTEGDWQDHAGEGVDQTQLVDD